MGGYAPYGLAVAEDESGVAVAEDEREEHALKQADRRGRSEWLIGLGCALCKQIRSRGRPSRTHPCRPREVCESHES
jgi:hypothetical protein